MEKFKEIIQSIEMFLTSKGFKKRGNTFYLKKDDNWGLLNFQKSRDKIVGGVKFTLNIGICSSLLRQKLEGDPSDKIPEVEESHWAARIGSIMPNNSDFWWIIYDTDSVKDSLADILEKIDLFALPAIMSHISDQNLEDEWMSGKYAGTSRINQYIYLTTLLKYYNKDTLQSKIDELKSLSIGKPFAKNANEHINWLIGSN